MDTRTPIRIRIRSNACKISCFQKVQSYLPSASNPVNTWTESFDSWEYWVYDLHLFYRLFCITWYCQTNNKSSPSNLQDASSLDFCLVISLISSPCRNWTGRPVSRSCPNNALHSPHMPENYHPADRSSFSVDYIKIRTLGLQERIPFYFCSHKRYIA